MLKKECFCKSSRSYDNNKSPLQLNYYLCTMYIVHSTPSLVELLECIFFTSDYWTIDVIVVLNTHPIYQCAIFYFRHLVPNHV